jgi:hypothetical protein
MITLDDQRKTVVLLVEKKATYKIEQDGDQTHRYGTKVN